MTERLYADRVVQDLARVLDSVGSAALLERRFSGRQGVTVQRGAASTLLSLLVDVMDELLRYDEAAEELSTSLRSLLAQSVLPALAGILRRHAEQAPATLAVIGTESRASKALQGDGFAKAAQALETLAQKVHTGPKCVDFSRARTPLIHLGSKLLSVGMLPLQTLADLNKVAVAASAAIETLLPSHMHMPEEVGSPSVLGSPRAPLACEPLTLVEQASWVDAADPTLAVLQAYKQIACSGTASASLLRLLQHWETALKHLRSAFSAVAEFGTALSKTPSLAREAKEEDEASAADEMAPAAAPDVFVPGVLAAGQDMETLSKLGALGGHVAAAVEATYRLLQATANLTSREVPCVEAGIMATFKLMPLLGARVREGVEAMARHSDERFQALPSESKAELQGMGQSDPSLVGAVLHRVAGCLASEKQRTQIGCMQALWFLRPSYSQLLSQFSMVGGDASTATQALSTVDNSFAAADTKFDTTFQDEPLADFKEGQAALPGLADIETGEKLEELFELFSSVGSETACSAALSGSVEGAVSDAELVELADKRPPVALINTLQALMAEGEGDDDMYGFKPSSLVNRDVWVAATEAVLKVHVAALKCGGKRKAPAPAPASAAAEEKADGAGAEEKSGDDAKEAAAEPQLLPVLPYPKAAAATAFRKLLAAGQSLLAFRRTERAKGAGLRALLQRYCEALGEKTRAKLESATAKAAGKGGGGGVPIESSPMCVAAKNVGSYSASLALPNGKFMAATRTGKLVEWNWPAHRRTVGDVKPTILSMAEMPGHLAAVGYASQHVSLYCLFQRKNVALAEHSAPGVRAVVSMGGRNFASGSSDGVVRVWKAVVKDEHGAEVAAGGQGTSGGPIGQFVEGDLVRLRAQVFQPRFGFNGVTHSEVGTVAKVVTSSKLIVNFPSNPQCPASAPELEHCDEKLLKIGDKVRVKDSIEKPSYGWGSVKHKMVGVVVKLDSSTSVRVDFADQQGWICKSEEMERVVDGVFTVGDRVRLKSSVAECTYGFGGATHQMCGTVRSVDPEKNLLKIDWDNAQQGWSGDWGELEHADRHLMPGDLLRVKPGIEKPRFGWGKVKAGHSGVMTQWLRDNNKVKVDFPAQQGWSADETEMQRLAAGVLQVDDYVRVKASVVEPSRGWGGTSRGDVGQVVKVDSGVVTVKFPAMADWEGDVGELEHVSAAGFNVGDIVQTVCETPKFGWGAVKKGDIGSISKLAGNDKVYCRFRAQSGWAAATSDLKVVLDRPFEAGDRVRVHPNLLKPSRGWGAVSHGDVGTVVEASGDEVTVKFWGHQRWVGLTHELQLVISEDFEVGDRVTVRGDVEKPKHGWGSVGHGEIGVVKKLDDSDKMVVDMSTQSGWSAHGPDMQRITHGVNEGGAWRVAAEREAAARQAATKRTTTIEAVEQLEGHGAPIVALAMLEEGSLVSADEAGAMRVWNVSDGSCSKVLPAEHPGAAPLCLAALSSGKLAAGCADGIVRVWDMQKGQVERMLLGHGERVLSAGELQDGRLVTGGADGEVRVWSVRDGSCSLQFVGHRRPVTTLATLPGGKLVTTAKRDVRVWDVAAAGFTGSAKRRSRGGKWSDEQVAGVDAARAALLTYISVVFHDECRSDPAMRMLAHTAVWTAAQWQTALRSGSVATWQTEVFQLLQRLGSSAATVRTSGDMASGDVEMFELLVVLQDLLVALEPDALPRPSSRSPGTSKRSRSAMRSLPPAREVDVGFSALVTAAGSAFTAKVVADGTIQITAAGTGGGAATQGALADIVEAFKAELTKLGLWEGDDFALDATGREATLALTEGQEAHMETVLGVLQGADPDGLCTIQ